MFVMSKKKFKVLMFTLIPVCIVLHFYLALFVFSKVSNFQKAIFDLLAILIYFTVILFFNNWYYKEQLNKDFKTGIYNERKLDEDIDKKIEKNKHFYCVFIDLDEFTSVNNTYGHLVGDKVLKDFAYRISKIKNCVAYRNGGDEFVIIINDNGKSKGQFNKVLEDLENVETIINIGQIQERTKFSMGIAHFQESATTKEDLLSVADSEMYRAKRDKKTEV